MEQLQQQEWYALQSRTWQLLRQGDHILRSKHTPLFQFLVRPSFADTWCIDIVKTGDEYGVYHTTWRMTRDREAFSTAMERLKHPRPYVPALESTRLEFGLLEVEAFLSRLSVVRIPLIHTRDWISLDGTSFEMQIGKGTRGILLQWHNQLPDEWAELSEIVELLIELPRKLTASTCSVQNSNEEKIDD